ncbi:MAG TPA: polysaccharide biosynthesis tyrosine autokinase [Caldithrix abyssi]|uniref:non-specific protein-tyrosine kinase n=1 Tax=Caldithrix abyssi TaxID=187145 RepID=A0A7V4U010_CALAY|nr:polysaccharide biosynthesis tyrosine autokinase [Caldithrix abyssi]
MVEYEEEVESQVSLNDYLRILYRSRWLIIISFIVVFSATVFYTFTTDPEYEASTTLIIQSTGVMERSLFDFDYFGNRSTLISNQVEILKSRNLAEQVVKRLDLSDVRDSLRLFQPNEEGEYLSLRDMVSILRGNMQIDHKKDTDVITLTYVAESPFAAAYIVNTIADEYQLLNTKANRVQLNELKDFVEQQVAKKEEELRLSEERLRDYQEQEKLTNLDEETAELVNTLATYEAKLEEAQISLQATLEFKKSLEEQLNERRESLSSEISQISTPYLRSLQEQLAMAVAERTKYVIAIETEAEDANRRFFESNIHLYDEKINALRKKLQEEAKKISSSSMVSDPFQLTQELVSKLLTSEAEIKAGTAKINALQEVVNQYSQKLDALPAKVLELARLERRRKVDEQTYILMVTKLEETKIQAAAQNRNVYVIDKAIEPLEPVRPKKKLNLLLGVLIGLGLGVGLAFVREYFDNSVKSPEELEQLGFNVLTSIPKIQMQKFEKKIESRLEKLGPIEGKKIEARLITHLDPKSPVSEAYRTLRTNLQFSKIENDLKTILITSSGPKEGKSTTAANLAIAMAQAGRDVVLIDADLRRPVVHSIFNMDKDNGITNYLMGTISFDELPKKTFMDNLSVITSGVLPPNPSELLASKKMEELLKQLKNRFEIVIIDSPPVVAVTDAAILSTKVDGTILVVASEQTNRDALKRAYSLLDSVETRLLGVLLNGVDVEGMYGSYYYYYYHHYYGKTGRKKSTFFGRFFS